MRNKGHEKAMIKDSNQPFMKAPDIAVDISEEKKLKAELAIQQMYIDNPMDITGEGGAIAGLPGPYVVIPAPNVSFLRIMPGGKTMKKSEKEIQEELGKALRLAQTVVGIGSACQNYKFGDKVILKSTASYESVFYYMNVKFMIVAELDIMFKVNPKKSSAFSSSYYDDLDAEIKKREEEAKALLPQTNT